MTKEQKQEKRLMMEFIVDEAILNPLEKVEHPKPAISFGFKSYESKDGEIIFPVPIGTYGNFSFVQAPHKSKKNWTSFWIKILICSRISLLNAEYNDIIRNIIFSIFNLF